MITSKEILKDIDTLYHKQITVNDLKELYVKISNYLDSIADDTIRLRIRDVFKVLVLCLFDKENPEKECSNEKLFNLVLELAESDIKQLTSLEN